MILAALVKICKEKSEALAFIFAIILGTKFVSQFGQSKFRFCKIVFGTVLQSNPFFTGGMFLLDESLLEGKPNSLIGSCPLKKHRKFADNG